jgi:hypothetical protein
MSSGLFFESCAIAARRARVETSQIESPLSRGNYGCLAIRRGTGVKTVLARHH